MKVLIDNVEGELVGVHLMGFDVDGRRCRVADHGSVLDAPYQGRDNFKVITSGHVYILNYVKETYKPQNALTFEQYRQLKKEGKPYL